MKEAVLIAGGKVLFRGLGWHYLRDNRGNIQNRHQPDFQFGAITHSAPSVDISLDVIKD